MADPEETAFFATPAVLTWARREWSLTVAQAAALAHIETARLLAAERGEGHLTVSEARRLAVVFHRQLAVFLMPEPPHDYDDTLTCPRCGREMPEA